MGSLTLTNIILEKYFNFLKKFDNNTKKKLIIKLTNSLEFKEKKPFDIKLLFGAWQDDRTSQEIIDEIKNSRIAPKDINL